MWTISAAPVSGDWMDIRPVRVLYEFDGPRVFVCHAADGSPHLAYLCGQSRTTQRFLVIPFDGEQEQELVTGRTDVREALHRPTVWLFDVANDGTVTACWQVLWADLPDRVLPKPGVMLYAHLPRPADRRQPVTTSTSVS